MSIEAQMQQALTAISNLEQKFDTFVASQTGTTTGTGTPAAPVDLTGVEAQLTALQTAVAAIPTTPEAATVDLSAVTAQLTEIQTQLTDVLADITDPSDSASTAAVKS